MIPIEAEDKTLRKLVSGIIFQVDEVFNFIKIIRLLLIRLKELIINPKQKKS